MSNLIQFPSRNIGEEVKRKRREFDLGMLTEVEYIEWLEDCIKYFRGKLT